MKEPAVAIQISNSEQEPTEWRWNIQRGSQVFVSGGTETLEPRVYHDAQSAADGAVRAFVRILQTPYQLADG